ncbi:replication initiation protein RepC [Agrobacterium tumefaciens]|uniref:plasmid replication protein RepC n=1 Tax=Agrobacterium tumefaciens TaxID=358 RepID=UPI001572A2C6|nr:plasmid replication protein RepC [Agrobacterium tumefaciens]NSZ03129.1 replication initiation protein RepC [Agrobacterium tumefaciens]NSZ39744.1 replication initiation protein RepC [Agrobacterium tumefaciens]NTB26702.1 replication initiation protein RepC [Agrobacterium tumefaciens]NTB29935.1 replication initiation protein RepC [Agrobacterium tumefaciens]NTB34349.1 replication initiation protein RepC [Agrobacterium tumefaciens]
METGYITTPFGRRPMTLALVERQVKTDQSVGDGSVDKWRVFRDVSDARSRLGLQDRALAVLNALVSFFPVAELSSEKNLVVFPSNAQLSARTNGIAGTTLRKCLGALVEAGVIIRKDSPNGKRYARKGHEGDIEDAYGFSLAPLVARAREFAALAQDVAAEQRRFRITKDRLTIVRRDVRKLITVGIEERLPGDWVAAEACFVEIVGRFARRPTIADLTASLDEMSLLHEEVSRMLETKEETTKNDGNAIAYGCHIQNSNTESCNELEPRSEKEQGEKSEPTRRPERKGEPEAFPLSMVLRACPEIVNFGPGGSIGSWREMMSAAITVRSMLGVSPSAYEDACEVMGQAAAAIAIACIYERAGHINSAGGYLRDLTAKARRGEFSLGPMLFTQLRANNAAERKTG